MFEVDRCRARVQYCKNPTVAQGADVVCCVYRYMQSSIEACLISDCPLSMAVSVCGGDARRGTKHVHSTCFSSMSFMSGWI